MIAPEVIDAMIAAGASAEVIAAAWKADLAKEEAKVEDRRAKDRERQRRHRASRNVAVTACDSTDAPPAALDKETPPTPPKEINPTTPRTHEGRGREAFPRPDWADRQVWSDLLANRRKKNLANTASAHRKLLADIAKLVDEDWPPGRVLEAAVSRGWGAIYASCKDESDDGRNANRASGNGNGGRLGGPRPDPTLALVRSAVAAQR